LRERTLHVTNGPDVECRYTLLPPESCRSDLELEATLRVAGPDDEPVAFLSSSAHGWALGPAVLQVAPTWLGLASNGPAHRRAADMTAERTVTLRHRGGLLEVLLDGKAVLHGPCFRDVVRKSDFYGGNPAARTQFGQLGARGESWWRRVSYNVRNSGLADIAWSWDAALGHWPDEYQRRRLLQIHANCAGQQPWPDNGYSSWVLLENDRIFLADYTNCGDEPGRSHLVGVYLEPEDWS
jgi:hypothetical protein